MLPKVRTQSYIATIQVRLLLVWAVNDDLTTALIKVEWLDKKTYRFHSDARCYLLSNFCEFVWKNLSVFCGFDRLYRCSKHLKMQNV